MERIKTRNLIMSGLFIAIGVVLPILFHTVNMLGPVFLPMHIPVLIAGFFLPPYLAMVVGAVTPLLSSVTTGMPILFPMGVIMMFELATYGAFVAWIRGRVASDYVALLSAMLIGRAVAGLVVFVLSIGFGVKMNALLFVKGGIVTGLPGIAVQLILIPIVVRALRKILK
ncbi:MAG: ECF transporter S component [Clostridia bacterium]|nr:ECF transporter S component [Clostridia bacterium]